MIEQASVERPRAAPEAAAGASPSPWRAAPWRAAVLFVLPLALLAGVIAVFLGTGGAGLNVTPAAPIEDIQLGRIVLEPGTVKVPFRNVGPGEITIAQVAINDAFWPFAIEPGASVPRLGAATVTLRYPWVERDAYAIKLFSSNSIVFPAAIPVAAETATPTSATLLSLTLVGIYVGIIPVLLGMLWLPALARVGAKGMTFLLAATAGLLAYLGIDATAEALETAAGLGGPFQGTGLVGVGVAGAFLLLSAVSAHRRPREAGAAAARMALAWTIAVGMGLHNLGEGLAIGAAYAVGAAALGTFLVVGFIVQNITEGLGILVPIARDRPRLGQLAWLGLVGGAPAILGAWIGGLSDSLPLSVLFLAVGAGAVFQVAVEIGRVLLADRRLSPIVAFAGGMTGMLALYVTGVLIK